MPYQVFQYPLPGPADLAELNAFLGMHRIIAVQEHLLTTPSGGLLVFVVQTVEAPTTGSSPSLASKRIDYKTVLNEEEFALFSRLREERKTIASEEGVPVFTIFTNEQLAEMVRRPVRALPDLAAIDGIGPARVEKHGKRMLALLIESSTNHSPS